MIDRTGSVYFIDVDGATFFDLECEHAFLQWRFGAQYARFARDDLDRVARAAIRMGELIEGLLGLANMSKEKFQPEELDLSSITEKVAEDLRGTEPTRCVEPTARPSRQPFDGRWPAPGATPAASRAPMRDGPGPFLDRRVAATRS